ncbi:hypothetical protein L345_16531, partial [Ophiophagus hannah]
MDRREKLAIGKVWIVTALSDLSARWLYRIVDLRHKHAFLSFVIKTKTGTSYDRAVSDFFAFEKFARSAFQCSYSSSGLSRKVWERCTEKENRGILSPAVVAKILSEDAYSIRNAIQVVSWTLSAAYTSQLGQKRRQVGSHPAPQPWQNTFHSLIPHIEKGSQIKIIVWQLDFQATAILSGLIQTSGRKNASVGGKVWIATTLKDLSITMFYYGVDLQHKHALFSFLTQRKARKQYHDFNSYSSAVFQFGKEAFQCSYTKAVKSKKVWERCKEKENWEFPLHDVATRMQSEDASAISKAIQAVALVLSAVSFSQWSKRRMHVGGHQLPQIIQPWQ